MNVNGIVRHPADGKVSMLTLARPFGLFIHWLTSLTHSLPLTAIICSAMITGLLVLVRRIFSTPQKKLEPILPTIIAIKEDKTLSRAERESKIGELYQSVHYTPFTMLGASLIPVLISILMFTALAYPAKCVYGKEVGEWANGMKQYDIIQDERYTADTGIDTTPVLYIGSHNMAKAPYKGDNALLVIPALMLVCGCVRQLLKKQELTSAGTLIMAILGCVIPAIIFIRLPAILGVYALTIQAIGILTALITKFSKRRTKHGES